MGIPFNRLQIAALVLLFSAAITACDWIGEKVLTDRTPCDYFMPEGFVGWAKITYGVVTAPRLPVRNGRYVVTFSARGEAETSTTFEAGSARDRYWYQTLLGYRQLPQTGWGGGGYIWAGYVEGSVKEPPIRQVFFVGSERQYYKAVHDPRGDQ